MTITVKLAPSASHPGTAARAAAEQGVTLTPMHPGSADAELRTWYVGSGSGDEYTTAEILRALPEVEAAYVKPDDFPPDSKV